MSRSGDFRGDNRQTNRQTDYFTSAHARGVMNIKKINNRTGIGPFNQMPEYTYIDNTYVRTSVDVCNIYDACNVSRAIGSSMDSIIRVRG